MRPSIPTRKRASRRVGPRRACGLPAGDEDALGLRQVLGDAEREEAAVERHLLRAEVEAVEFGARRGQQVGSLGEPIWLAAGTIRPRASRRVFSQTSTRWTTWPNSVGARSLPCGFEPALAAPDRARAVSDARRVRLATVAGSRASAVFASAARPMLSGSEHQPRSRSSRSGPVLSDVLCEVGVTDAALVGPRKAPRCPSRSSTLMWVARLALGLMRVLVREPGSAFGVAAARRAR
jgi:hypothetical protein